MVDGHRMNELMEHVNCRVKDEEMQIFFISTAKHSLRPPAPHPE